MQAIILTCPFMDLSFYSWRCAESSRSPSGIATVKADEQFTWTFYALGRQMLKPMHPLLYLNNSRLLPKVAGMIYVIPKNFIKLSIQENPRRSIRLVF
jgi:hypothetical protein